jgi:hypothetical protein
MSAIVPLHRNAVFDEDTHIEMADDLLGRILVKFR